MGSKATKASGLSGRTWLFIFVVAVALGVAIYATWTNQYLGGRLTGESVSRLYTPLVRNVLASQTHCYDNGDSWCERFLQTGGEKEFTLAYLFREAPKGLKRNTIYGCFNPRSLDYYVTVNNRECRQRGMRPHWLGWTALSDEFETSIELFRCYSEDANNYLVTEDRNECELAQHTDEIVSLGYAAAAGHLPERRLQGLCLAVEQANVLSDAQEAFCSNLNLDPQASGEGEEDEPTVSWHNAANKYDIDGDGIVSPTDVRRIVNKFNSDGAHKLTVEQDGSAPPYWDVVEDGHLTHLDVQAAADAASSPTPRRGR